MQFCFELNLQMPKSKLAVSNKIGLLYSIETKQLEEQVIGWLSVRDSEVERDRM